MDSYDWLYYLYYSNLKMNIWGSPPQTKMLKK